MHFSGSFRASFFCVLGKEGEGEWHQGKWTGGLVSRMGELLFWCSFAKKYKRFGKRYPKFIIDGEYCRGSWYRYSNKKHGAL